MQERNIDWLLSAHTATSYQTHDAGVYSDQELNLPPFAQWDNAQPTEPQGSALYTCFCCRTKHCFVAESYFCQVCKCVMYVLIEHNIFLITFTDIIKINLKAIKSIQAYTFTNIYVYI